MENKKCRPKTGRHQGIFFIKTRHKNKRVMGIEEITKAENPHRMEVLAIGLS